jgi:two-component sensor histidine kinase
MIDRLLQLVPKRPLPMGVTLLIAAAGIGLATLVRWAITPLVGNDIPFASYFPAVLIVAVWGGPAAGVVCAVASGLLATWLFSGGRGFDALAFWKLAAFLIACCVQVGVAWLLIHAVRGQAAAEAQSEQVQTELRTLVNELGHRAKNGLTIVMSIVSQSARNAASPEEAEQAINSRLGAMAKAQDLITEGGGVPVQLFGLLETILTPFDWARFRIEHRPQRLVVGPQVAGALALLLNEMATNALKYGSLSVKPGTVTLTWTLEPSGMASLLWQEVGGPAVAPVNRSGFGARLLQTALHAVGGSAERHFMLNGVGYTLVFPAESIVRDPTLIHATPAPAARG